MSGNQAAPKTPSDTTPPDSSPRGESAETLRRWSPRGLLLLSGISAAIIASLSYLVTLEARLFPTQRVAVEAMPLQQQLGVALVLFSAAIALIAYIWLGKEAARVLVSMQTRSDVATVVTGPFADLKRTLAELIQSVSGLRADLRRWFLSTRPESDDHSGASGSASVAAESDPSLVVYGPPNDTSQLPIPAAYIPHESIVERIAATLATTSPKRGAWVWGPPMVGKTTAVGMAIRLVSDDDAWARFPDGILLVDCDQTSDPDEALRTILRRLDPARRTVSVAPKLLPDYAQTRLKRKSALFVLDHVPLGARFVPVVSTLLSAGPSTRVVVITNEPPPAATLGELVPVDAREWSTEQAAQLFLQIYFDDPNIQLHTLSADDQKAVQTIVESAACLPNFVQTTAAHARLMGYSLSHVAPRLENGPPDGEARQRAHKLHERYARDLQAIREYERDTAKLLVAAAAFGTRNVGKRALFALGASIGIADPDHALTTLTRLKEVQFITTRALPPGADTERWMIHPLKFDFLQREFEQWTAEDRRDAHLAAARYFSTYLNQIPPTAIAIEEKAVIAALNWAQQSESAPYAEAIVGLATPVAQFWRDRWDNKHSKKYLKFMIEQARLVARRTGAQRDHLRVADLILLLGRSYRHSGAMREAQQYFEENLRIRRRRAPKDATGEASAWYHLAQSHRVEGHLGRAERYCERSLACARRSHAAKISGLAATELGRIARIRGQTSRAVAYFTDAYQQLLDLGALLDAGVPSGYLGRIARMQGYMVTARAYFDESKRLAREADDARGEGIVKSYEGRLLRTAGNMSGARKKFKDSYRIARTFDDKSTVASVTGYLARLDFVQGDLKSAAKGFNKSYRMANKIGDAHNAAMAMGYLGRIYLATGHRAKAIRWRLQAWWMVSRVGDRRGQALATRSRARFALDLGWLPIAASLARRSRAELVKIGDQHGVASVDRLQAAILAAQGKLDEAQARLQACKLHYEQMEDAGGSFTCAYWLGLISETMRQIEVAKVYYEEAYTGADRVEDLWIKARIARRLGPLLEQDPATRARGRSLIAQSNDITARMGIKLPHERIQRPG